MTLSVPSTGRDRLSADAAEAPAAPVECRGNRVTGYDLARAAAILGMVVVHFTLVTSSGRTDTGWVGRVVGFLDGRAAATFVVLAGVGVTLRSRRAASSGDRAALAAVRVVLMKRGLFLLAAGFVNLLIWPGDILRVYGVSLLLAAWLIDARGRWILAAAAAFVAGFLALMAAVDYSKNWDWAAMQYHHLWTPAGAVRNLFYDGFRSVFPWTGLLFFGMWLGRVDLQSPRAARRVLVAGILLLVLSSLVSRALLRAVPARVDPAMDRETAEALFGLGSMPPLPLFLMSAVGSALVTITASVWLADRFPRSRLIEALVATGQMAFTWYVGHIILGIGALILLGLVDDKPVLSGVAAAAVFFGVAGAVSIYWRRRGRRGPLESLMRRVAG